MNTTWPFVKRKLKSRGFPNVDNKTGSAWLLPYCHRNMSVSCTVRSLDYNQYSIFLKIYSWWYVYHKKHYVGSHNLLTQIENDPKHKTDSGFSVFLFNTAYIYTCIKLHFSKISWSVYGRIFTFNQKIFKSFIDYLDIIFLTCRFQDFMR